MRSNGMSKLLFATTLLFILVSVSLPLHAQRKVGTVEFSLCNAGKVDVDVFLSSSGKFRARTSALQTVSLSPRLWGQWSRATSELRSAIPAGNGERPTGWTSFPNGVPFRTP